MRKVMRFVKGFKVINANMTIYENGQLVTVTQLQNDAKKYNMDYNAYLAEMDLVAVDYVPCAVEI